MSTTLDFLCGLAAGWSQIITGQPFDFIKLKYQLSKTSNSGAISFARQIFKDHGLMGFYRGSSSLFFGFSFTVAMEFAIYEACKKYMLKGYSNVSGKIPQEVLSLKQIFLSGSIVGSAVAFVYCPVQYAKIQKQTSANIKEGSFRILLNQTYKSGIANIYKGLTVTIMREVMGSAFYFASYQNAVRKICEYQGVPRRFAHYSTFLISGAVAGLSYWIISYPFDVIKTKIQAGENKSEIIKNLYKNAYRGFPVIALRSIIVNAFSFATFEQIKRITLMLTQFSVV